MLSQEKQRITRKWFPRASWLALLSLAWMQLAIAGHQFEHSAAYTEFCDVCVQVDRLDDLVAESIGLAVERQEFDIGDHEVVAANSFRVDAVIKSQGRVDQPIGGFVFTEVLQDEVIQQGLEAVVVERAKEVKVSPIMSRVVDAAIAGDHHQSILESVLNGLGTFMEDNRASFRYRLTRESPWWVATAVPVAPRRSGVVMPSSVSVAPMASERMIFAMLLQLALGSALILLTMAVSAVFCFIFSWNEFLFALTFILTDQQRTVPVAIALLSGASVYELPWGHIMAASVIVTVPLVLLVLVFQRRIVAGLTAGAVKA